LSLRVRKQNRLAPAQTLSIPADSPRWALEGQASVTDYQGRKSLLLDGAAAVVKDFEMRDGVVDVKKLSIGYSDEVSVFLNGKILYRGRAAQGFREPGFLGIISPEDDAVYLPLKKGSNELMLAVSEIGGGWGFICRLTDLP
jgi:hypothetical protein